MDKVLKTVQLLTLILIFFGLPRVHLAPILRL
jgi:hypothetical protein